MAIIRIAFAILVVCLAGARHAFAETEHVGPLSVAARVNGVELSPAVDGTLGIDTAKGDFNANLDFKLSSPTAPLTNSIVAILKTLLPIKIPTPKCSLLITDVLRVSVSSQDNEADVDGAVVMALRDCTVFNREDVNVPISIAVIAAASPPNQINWKIVRKPVLGVPASWFVVLELTEGSPQQVLQHFLDGYASIKLPQIKGIRAAVQGANFDGDQHNLSFRIKGDAHANGVDLTSLLTRLVPLINSNLDFKVQLPK
jgi:hypothetical protein